MSVLASLAGAVVWIGELPVKLNPIIQPLMTAIKREQVLLCIFCHFPTYVILYFSLQLQVFEIKKNVCNVKGPCNLLELSDWNIIM